MVKRHAHQGPRQSTLDASNAAWPAHWDTAPERRLGTGFGCPGLLRTPLQIRRP